MRRVSLERSETEGGCSYNSSRLIYMWALPMAEVLRQTLRTIHPFVPGQTACVHPICLLTLPLYILASAPGASPSPVFCQTSSCLVSAAGQAVVRYIVPLRRRGFVCSRTTDPSTNVETAAAHSRHVDSNRRLPSLDRDIKPRSQLGYRRRVCCRCLGQLVRRYPYLPWSADCHHCHCRRRR